MVQGFCDDNPKAEVSKRVTIGGGGQKLPKKCEVIYGLPHVGLLSHEF